MDDLKCMLFAVDGGPRSVLEPLSGQPQYLLVKYEEREALSQYYWEQRLNGYSALILGTSDSDVGRAMEGACHKAATKLGILTIVIEDYPGNYRPRAECRTDLLVVDGVFAEQLHQENLSEAVPPIWICPSVRFDGLRRKSKRSRQRYQDIRSNKDHKASVMWIGQPETEDAIETLGRLWEDISSLGVELLFKAHPRDTGYERGRYNNLFNSAIVPVTDVSHLSLDACYEMAPALAITQFSSMAIELGFLGVPSVHVLYRDVGGQRLQDKKGFMIPPWCDLGASFLIDEEAGQSEILSVALNGIDERSRVLSKFDAYFQTANSTLPDLLARIQRDVLNHDMRH